MSNAPTQHRLVSPTGAEIIGTIERIPGVAFICPSFQQDADGKMQWSFEHEGETKVDWDGQETVTACGETLFQDENGAEWLQRELLVVPAE